MPDKIKIYKYYNGHMVIAEIRKTKKMYVVDKILNKKNGYHGLYETERIYEKDISFTAKQEFQNQRNKLKTRIGMYKEAMEKACDDYLSLDIYEGKFKEDK